MVKTYIKNTIIGTQTIVVQVIDKVVTFLSIPYGTRNILVLVTGKNELITIIANHAVEISPRIMSKPKTIDIIKGVITTVRRKTLLTHGQ